MRNPLNHRFKRDLKDELGKYIALFLFMVLMIGLVSGFLVADNSMTIAYDESFDKYKIEDGHFVLATCADDELVKKLEDENVSIYELFYKNAETDSGDTIRVYKTRNGIDEVCLMDGVLPQHKYDIAIDRLYAENNGIKIGDKLDIGGESCNVCGFVALSDYSALFKNNTDMMLDANRFAVAIVGNEGYKSLDIDEKHCYAWQNNEEDISQADRDEISDRLKALLRETGMLTEFVRVEDNQAITFTGEDMGSDKAMMVCLLYVVMVVLAFVFAVTTKSTLEKEAMVIGTLRASGYKKGELISHYLTMPMLVTLAAAIAGNILGYTVIKNICAAMYYHSYSLPTYVTVWNADAFLKTTVVPGVIILLVNLLVLGRTLSLPPIQFLRNELKRKQKKKVVRLPNWRFLARFRMRIILQNLTAYLTMFVGILLASVLLLFGMLMSPLLSHFKEAVIESQIAEYQYILKAPIATDTAGAEKYSVTSLNIPDGGEEITVYGIAADSEYLSDLNMNLKSGEAVVSNGYLEKYGLKIGDKFTLEEKYGNETYSFVIADSYNYSAALSIFIPADSFNKTFEYNSGYFNGYFTDEKLTDIDSGYVASVITRDDLTVVADQLDDSMGSMFILVCGFAAMLYVLLMYLLAKLVVDKNAKSISMIKILGYSNSEAGKLYNVATAIVVIVSLIISIPVSNLIMKKLYYTFMQEIKGWLTYYVAPWIYPAMFIIGIVCYLIVYLVQIKKIGKISMSQALKDME